MTACLLSFVGGADKSKAKGNEFATDWFIALKESCTLDV